MGKTCTLQNGMELAEGSIYAVRTKREIRKTVWNGTYWDGEYVDSFQAKFKQELKTPFGLYVVFVGVEDEKDYYQFQKDEIQSVLGIF